jgi:malonyl-CoA/methylmalonyl-CoA synthetase
MGPTRRSRTGFRDMRAGNSHLLSPDHDLLPAVLEGSDRLALRTSDRQITYAQLRGLAGDVARRLHRYKRAAVWAERNADTCVAVVGGLLAGVPIIPVNSKAGERELTHLLADSNPDVVVARSDCELPGKLSSRPRFSVDWDAQSPKRLAVEKTSSSAPAFIVYTSGTTGPPKGVVLGRGALSANLDALAQAWEWTDGDVVAHALPLFHVHGLILGVVGPLRRGGGVYLLDRFEPASVSRALETTTTMLFAVPTMYHRLAKEAETDPRLATALARARLLVSGSAPLAASDHARIKSVTGQSVVERYGMTETLIICSTRASGLRRPGTVGPALEGVSLRLVDEDGVAVPADSESLGEVEVRSPSLFSEYINRPQDTANAFREGWFRTGDVGTQGSDGCLRLVGRSSADVIKTGGYKVGAGEIEAAIASHPDVAEVAVTGEPDADLGQRIVAWLVPAGPRRPPVDDIAEHVVALLSPHKRPREVRYLRALPRNAMGKVAKAQLVKHSGPPQRE